MKNILRATESHTAQLNLSAVYQGTLHLGGRYDGGIQAACRRRPLAFIVRLGPHAGPTIADVTVILRAMAAFRLSTLSAKCASVVPRTGLLIPGAAYQGASGLTEMLSQHGAGESALATVAFIVRLGPHAGPTIAGVTVMVRATEPVVHQYLVAVAFKWRWNRLSMYGINAGGCVGMGGNLMSAFHNAHISAH